MITIFIRRKATTEFFYRYKHIKTYDTKRQEHAAYRPMLL